MGALYLELAGLELNGAAIQIWFTYRYLNY